MQTLNQILDLIKTTSENHTQVNKFLFSRDWDFETEGQVVYPLVGCALVNPAVRTKNMIVYDFTIFVADLVHKDRSNEQEVLSDTIQIAVDLESYIAQGFYDLDININREQSTSFTPFTEKWDSEVSGWSFNLKIEVPSINDSCQIPVRNE